MEKEQEIWVGVDGYESIYHVSNFGRVRVAKRVIVNKNGRVVEYAPYILSMHKRSNGFYVYFRVNYVQKCFTVHGLVAERFVENKTGGTLIKHKDGNQYNNHYTNLEWVKRPDHFSAANKAAGYVYQRSPKKKRPVLQFSLDGQLVARWEGLEVASLRTGANISSISKVCNGKMRTTQGFIWQFEADDE